MEKVEDLILKRQELEKKLVEDINDANLPAFIIKPILQDLLHQTFIQEREQLELAKNNKRKR